MRFNWIDRLGDWNPQLMREIKGRLKTRDVLIAGVISLFGQFFLFRDFQNQLPHSWVGRLNSDVYNKYCQSADSNYGSLKCLIDSAGNIDINWHLWWLDLFAQLSLIGVFTLLVGGTYMLISDLSNEERRDTLNFIRLSPQSGWSILIGKLLGVPILLESSNF